MYLFVRNLQGAVCSYFELYPQDPPVMISLPRMALVHSEGAGGAERASDPAPMRALTPSQPFTQTWTIMNTGLSSLFFRLLFFIHVAVIYHLKIIWNDYFPRTLLFIS